jgi:hypothetical protein
MKYFIITSITLFTLNVNAFEKCFHTIGEQEIELNRIQPSEKLSFKDCPESILINNQAVRHLSNVELKDSKMLCTYGGLGLLLTCSL